MACAEEGHAVSLHNDCGVTEQNLHKHSEILLEKMNKTGVRYKSGTIAQEEENLYGQNSESKYENKYPNKEFQYDDIHTPNGQNGSGNYDLDSEGGDSFKLSTGHLSSYKGEKDDPIDVLEQSEKREASYLKTDEIEVTRWEVETNEQEVSQGMSDDNSEIEDKKEVILGKRRRTVSKYQKSPYVKKTPKKRAKRSAKAKLLNETSPQFDHSVDDVVRAAVQYVKAYDHSPKHKNHEIFNNGKDEGLCAVIDAYVTYISDSSIAKDRNLLIVREKE
ncbi:uncharacterized protein [Aegilops tauschii subsp. strangulata]|uniref:uncharacterized protein n=1 Tax=Aegilops tauschii subsp. strangulata TaxID=200361 RepID=UPI003CC8C810